MNTTFLTPVQYQQGNGKITREKLSTLRALSMQEHKGRKCFASFLSELSSFVSGLLTAHCESGRHTMCKQYGHIIRGSFYSYPPRCSDCNARIHNPEELRKATPIS